MNLYILVLYALLTHMGCDAPVEANYINQHAYRQPSMDVFIGVNALIDDPIDKIEVAGSVREYHKWNWNDRPYGEKYTGYPNNLLVFNLWNGSWNFDEFYRILHNKEISVIPCIKEGSLKYINNDKGKPVKPGSDTEDPNSYAIRADYFFQYAARYGNSEVAIEKLKVRKDIKQKIISGLGYIKYIEDWNEPNAWWLGKDWEFSPNEFSAMLSADCDGHLGKMGNEFGAKSADPGMKIVMGGLVGLDLDYLKKMVEWAQIHRNDSMPFDVINMHHYAYEKGLSESSRIGVSPEQDHFKDKVMEIVKYRDEYLPNKEIWITEFGYDTHLESVQRAPVIGDLSSEEIQARWLLRSYLILASTGIERAFMYMLRDYDEGSGSKYSTSGLVGEKGSWKPKTSWYYTYTLKNALKNMHFNRVLDTKDQDVYHYEFIDRNSGKVANVIWLGTSENQVRNNFRIKVGDNKNAKIVHFKQGNIDGLESDLTVVDAYVEVDISECPIIITVDKQ